MEILQLGKTTKEEIGVKKRIDSKATDSASMELAKRIKKLIPQSLTGGKESIEELAEAVTETEGGVFDSHELTDEDCEALGVTGLLVETVRRLEREYTMSRTRKDGSIFGVEAEIDDESKRMSVELQQTITRLALECFDPVSMDFKGGYANLLEAMMELSDYYLQIGKDKMTLVTGQSGVMDGIRGMITAAIMFKTMGAEVYLPEVDDDVFRGTDLIVVIDGKKVAVGIKTKGKHQTKRGLSDPCEMFVVRDSPYEDAKMIYLNFPNYKKEDEVYGWGPFKTENGEYGDFYAYGIHGVTHVRMGVPTRAALFWFAGEYKKVKERI